MAAKGQWMPLESNENVMNVYLQKLGVMDGPGSFQFSEVLSLEPWACEMVPKPCVAVLCCFPISDASEAHAAQEAAQIASAGQTLSPNVFYMKQTIGNACGTIGILHALGNVKSHLAIAPGSYLEGFFRAVAGMDSAGIGRYLETDDRLEEVHEEAAAEVSGGGRGGGGEYV